MILITKVPALSRFLAPLALFTLLSGCLDVDVMMDFKDTETAEMAVSMVMSREFYDATGGNKGKGICPTPKGGKGADLVVGDKEVTCSATKTVLVEDVISGAAAKGSKGVDADKMAKVERIDDTTLRVTMDLTGLMQQRPKQQAGGAEDMLRAAFAGHNLTFRIKAPRIVETTGELSDDGTTATKTVPIAAFIDANPDFGAPFVTTLKLEESCYLWLFCF